MAKFVLPLDIAIKQAAIGSVNLFPPQIAEPADKALYQSFLGTPVFDHLVFRPDNTDFQTGRTDEFSRGFDINALIMDDVLLTVTISKVIVKTPINGRNGTVKEYIALDDFTIDVRGFIVSRNPDEFPFAQLDLLKLYLDLEQQITIDSKFLDIFKIRSLVIESGRADQQAGFRNRVPFTLKCISDEDIELQLSEDVNSQE